MKENKIKQRADGVGRLPKHIAIIMDGNGRWAKRRLMPRSFGHKMGVDRMIGLLERAYDIGIPFVTVYALSTENLKRPKEELDGLFNLVRTRFLECIQKVCARGIRLRVIGDRSLLPLDVQEIIKKGTSENDEIIFSIDKQFSPDSTVPKY